MTPMEILQITDLHLTTDREAELKGTRTHDSLRDVLRFVDDRDGAEESRFDFLLLTGDMAHDGERETYRLLREMLGDRLPRCRFVPGNHDDRAALREVFPELAQPDGDAVCFSEESAGWRLIGLDSLVEGETHGRLRESQLAWLQNELSTWSAQQTILFLHHPPVSVRSPWLDRIGLLNADALLELVGRFPQVRAISTGHVHQEFSASRDRIEILTTPSTGVQFRPRTEELVVEPAPPAFRVIRLGGDGFETEVVRLPARE